MKAESRLLISSHTGRVALSLAGCFTLGNQVVSTEQARLGIHCWSSAGICWTGHCHRSTRCYTPRPRCSPPPAAPSPLLPGRRTIQSSFHNKSGGFRCCGCRPAQQSCKSDSQCRVQSSISQQQPCQPSVVMSRHPHRNQHHRPNR